MSSNDDSVIVQVEETNGGIDVGDTVTGTVSRTELRVWEGPDGDVTYFDIYVTEDSSGIEFNPSYSISGAGDDSYRITEATQMGQLIMRFGESLTVGESLDLNDIFSPGTKVEFEIDSDEAPDDDERDYYLRCDKESLRPTGEPAPEASVGDSPVDSGTTGNPQESDGGSDGEDDHAKVLEFIAENDLEGEDRTDVMKALAKEDGAMVKAFKELENTPSVDTDAGVVLLGN